MVADVQENNKQYVLMTKSLIKKYLMTKYKCSAYMANEAIKKLFKEE
jgi:hypothetical protein